MVQSDTRSPDHDFQTGSEENQKFAYNTQNTGVYSRKIKLDKCSVISKTHIKQLATLNDIDFIVIDKEIIKELGITDATKVLMKQTITKDHNGILLKIVKSGLD